MFILKFSSFHSVCTVTEFERKISRVRMRREREILGIFLKNMKRTSTDELEREREREREGKRDSMSHRPMPNKVLPRIFFTFSFSV